MLDAIGMRELHERQGIWRMADCRVRHVDARRRGSVGDGAAHRSYATSLSCCAPYYDQRSSPGCSIRRDLSLAGGVGRDRPTQTTESPSPALMALLGGRNGRFHRHLSLSLFRLASGACAASVTPKAARNEYVSAEGRFHMASLWLRLLVGELISTLKDSVK
jgi:hypothetical protein